MPRNGAANILPVFFQPVIGRLVTERGTGFHVCAAIRDVTKLFLSATNR
jgi:hypothetical protein